MADKSKIEWTDATWNPVKGCSLVSAGCTNCYAMRQAHRLKSYADLTRLTEHGPVWTGTVYEIDAQLYNPLFWTRGRKIFVTSMSDLFHEKVSDSFIAQTFAVMALARQHIFQGTTKRAERQRDFISHDSAMVFDAFRILRIDCGHRTCIDKRRLPGGYEEVLWPGWPLPNFWAGVSVEDQKTADERIPLLLKTPAAVRWISAEPLLGPIDLTGWFYSEEPGGLASNRLHWIVVGGESGPRARPVHPDWVRSILDQCQAAGVPFFFKQWGEWRIGESKDFGIYRMEELNLGNGSNSGKQLMSRVGKKAAGRRLDGREWNEYPNDQTTE